MKKPRMAGRRCTAGMVLLAVLSLSAAVAQAADAGAPIPFRAMAKVSVDQAGRPTKVEATSVLPKAVREAIEQQVVAWRFQSPEVDGVARGGVTYVSLGACAVPEPDGSLRLALDYQGNGPGYADDAVRLPPPRYPPDLARRRQSGEWTVDYVVERDGSATFVSIAETKPNQPFVKLVEPALRTWVESLRFLPEEIGGAPVRTRLSTPVRFLMSQSPSGEQREVESSKECSAVTDRGAEERPVALDSPFRRLDAG